MAQAMFADDGVLVRTFDMLVERLSHLEARADLRDAERRHELEHAPRDTHVSALAFGGPTVIMRKRYVTTGAPGWALDPVCMEWYLDRLVGERVVYATRAWAGGAPGPWDAELEAAWGAPAVARFRAAALAWWAREAPGDGDDDDGAARAPLACADAGIDAPFLKSADDAAFDAVLRRRLAAAGVELIAWADAGGAVLQGRGGALAACARVLQEAWAMLRELRASAGEAAKEGCDFCMPWAVDVWPARWPQLHAALFAGSTAAVRREWGALDEYERRAVAAEARRPDGGGRVLLSELEGHGVAAP